MSRQDRHVHDRARQLAASAIDYGLTVAQSAALDGHLVTCPACARSAAAMRGDAIALQPQTTPVPSRRIDDAVAAAIAGRRATSSSLLVLAAAALLLIALLGVAAAAGGLLLRFVLVSEPLAQSRFDAVFLRPPAEGNPTGPSTIWAVGADGTERLLVSVPRTSVPRIAPHSAMVQWMSMSEAGHLALRTLDGDRIGWAILDVTDPGARPTPVALPDDADTVQSYAVWGPGERLAIVLAPWGFDPAVAFVDPASGAATVHPLTFPQHVCFGDRCGVWAADGSGLVIELGSPSSGLAILGPDGNVAPFGSRVRPNNIGDRDVNATGELLHGGTDPMDQLTPTSDSLSVRTPAGDERWLLRAGAMEIADRAWAADGQGAWFMTAEWLAASRPVILERFTPPSTRTVIATFVAAVDVPAQDIYAPAATFSGIAPDDSMAVVRVAMTSTESTVFEGKLVDLRSGASTDVEGSFVGWLASPE